MGNYRLGQRYECPPGESFADALAEVRRTRVGDVPVKLDLIGGGSVVGLLEGAGATPMGEATIELDTGLPDRREYVEDRDIDAFMLLREPPLDRSDELR
jgi:hypothetical protein